jgi:D-psicose/D-tagatose/L-ribulose 3-epimerase
MSTNPIGVISMFYARPFEKAHFGTFARARDAGMKFVELLVPEPGELDPAETKAALRDAGLGVVFAARVNLQRDLSSPDEGARKAGLDYLLSCVDTAKAFGAKIVGGPLYGAPLVFAGRPPAPVDAAARERRIGWVIDGLTKAARRAADNGIVFGLEPLNRFETDIANTTEHALALVDAVGSPALGAMLDTFHMNMEDRDIAAAIRKAGKRMIHFQANENHRGFVGDGHIDWPAVARAIVAVGYDGPITLEPFRRDDVAPGICVAQWRAPHRNEDKELAASCAFLEATLASARRAA